MTDAVFDTTVFIDYYTGHTGADRLFADVFEWRLIAAFSPITVYELWSRPLGCDEEVMLRFLLLEVSEEPFLAEHAMTVGIWLRGLTRQQRLRYAADAMTAATAERLGATIYTRNPRDFARLQVDVQSY